jgi:hypothetical protein
MTTRSGRSVISHLVGVTAQMQRLFELSLHRGKGAPHAVEFEVAASHLWFHQRTARSM